MKGLLVGSRDWVNGWGGYRTGKCKVVGIPLVGRLTKARSKLM